MNIKELRKKLGYSQMKLASEVGVSLITVRTWEAGIGTPNEENMAKLKSVLKIEVE